MSAYGNVRETKRQRDRERDRQREIERDGMCRVNKFHLTAFISLCSLSKLFQIKLCKLVCILKIGLSKWVVVINLLN